MPHVFRREMPMRMRVFNSVQPNIFNDFQPAAFEQVSAQLSIDMGTAIATLIQISDQDSFGLHLNPADIWFDYNSNGTRDANEGVFNHAGTGPLRETDFAIEVRFDSSDKYWLLSRAHLFAGAGALVQALHPTGAITEV